MKVFKTAALVTMSLFLVTACSSNKKEKKSEPKALTSVLQEEITQDSINRHIAEWPEASKKATQSTIEKYGLPTSFSESTLVWDNVGPFRRTVVYKEEVVHLFPKPHTDVIEHFVNYPSPRADQVARVWEYDGSVNLQRTSGLMSARCDREEANVLALNLADKVIKGEMSVDEARLKYGEEILALGEAEGQGTHLTKTLVFAPAKNEAGDPDHTILDRIKRDRALEAQEDY